MSRKRSGHSHSSGCETINVEHIDQFLASDLYRLFERMQAVNYPEDKRNHLACPFWKFQPGAYQHVRNSNCLFWGFRDIGELNEHIARRHCKVPKSKEKGDAVPIMSSKNEEKWKEVNLKKAGSTESKWWKIAKAVIGVRIPDERPRDFHLHFPGPDIYLIERFESYRCGGSSSGSNSSYSSSPDINDFGSPQYDDGTAVGSGHGSGFSDPFNTRKTPSKYTIPAGTDSAYYSNDATMTDAMMLDGNAYGAGMEPAMYPVDANNLFPSGPTMADLYYSQNNYPTDLNADFPE